MSHQPLARKYRPSTFTELLGQDATAKALASAIELKRYPQAAIFTGVRGVGKTTTARIYAKALNCDQGPTPQPCSQCESCLAIAKGRHEDVIEIDGASHTGVADVRALQETIDYVPQRSTFKVYIIDEVHMLSQAAFNALLKTLEEPPAHVVFLLATTELAKVPQTIVSRCQTFFLQKFTLPAIRDHLEEVLASEGIEFEPKALSAIAREGHGSMRDALTLLDHAIALGAGRVTVEGLEAIISNLSSSPYIDLLCAMVKRDRDAAMGIIHDLDQRGIEFSVGAEEAARLARHAFVLRDLGREAIDAKLTGLDEGEMNALVELAEQAPKFELNRIFRTFVRCRSELDGSGIDRFIFENYVLEWCMDPGLPLLENLSREGAEPQADPARKSLSQRLSQAQADLKTGPTSQGARKGEPASRPSSVGAAKEESAPQRASSAKEESAPRFPATWRAFVECWKKEKPLQARKLEEVHPVEYSAAKIVVAVSRASYASKSLLDTEEQSNLRRQFLEVFGFQGRFTVVIKEELEVAASVPSEPAPDLADTILEEKSAERAAQEQKIATEARENPLTKELLAAFGGAIRDIEVKESALRSDT